MMETLPADAYPQLYRIVLIVGWGVGAGIMLWDWRRDRAKRWLGVLFAIIALHYLGLTLGFHGGAVARFAVPAALVALYAEVIGPRWLWWMVPMAVCAGFLAVSWVICMAIFVSALYIKAHPLGRAIFIAGAPMLVMLLAELLPGFREWATGPIFPLLLWAMVTVQLYLPAWAIYRSGRAGEGHWLVCN